MKKPPFLTGQQTDRLRGPILPYRHNKTTGLLPLLGLFILLGAGMVKAADELGLSMELSISNNREEQKLQTRIERLDDKARKMLEEYQSASRELESLRTYNDQVERLVRSQEEEKASLHEQMTDIELTQREIVPLMLRMIEQLDLFIQRDIPFLPDERTARVAQLRALMDRADVSVAEKYRRVLEAYQIEMEYGRVLEAYRAEQTTGNGRRLVDFLRVGRVGLYYLTLDGGQAGYWDPEKKGWSELPARYRPAVRRGLRMARKQAAPDLLRLPVPAPEHGND
ncbi:MAG TPA: DUF3450 domain-containing protein [Sedimenticola sp.]|nr:DUF3450 domain-containing protein [Sedimenticola sp.]